MRNLCGAAGLRLTVLLSLLWIGNAPVSGQIFLGNPYDASLGRSPFGFPGGGSCDWEASMPRLPRIPHLAPAGPATVSTDVLRAPALFES